MKSILGLLLFLTCCGFPGPIVAAGFTPDEERLIAEVMRFLRWHKKSDPEELHRWADRKGTAPTISEAARFRGMYLVPSCDVTLADEFFSLAKDLDPGNTLVDQAREEKQAYLTKRSQELSRDAWHAEARARDIDARTPRKKKASLQPLWEKSRLLYEEAFACDRSNVAAFLGYERTARHQYGAHYIPGELMRKFASR